jgi:acyl carrier protein
MDDMARQMVDYLGQKVLRKPSLPIDENTPLLSSGLIDSFALIDILVQLEKVTGRRIPTGRVSPQDMDTVRKMLETAQSVGKPRT